MLIDYGCGIQIIIDCGCGIQMAIDCGYGCRCGCNIEICECSWRSGFVLLQIICGCRYTAHYYNFYLFILFIHLYLFTIIIVFFLYCGCRIQIPIDCIFRWLYGFQIFIVFGCRFQIFINNADVMILKFADVDAYEILMRISLPSLINTMEWGRCILIPKK